MLQSAWFPIAVGVVVGVFVGLVGTSGAFIVPVLIYLFGLSQLKAQGTSLFIALLPIWIFPLFSYARAGNVQWRLGWLMAAGLAAGSFFGARWAQSLPDVWVRKGFAVVLLSVAFRMLLQK